jgi:hypothetical protein
MRPRRTIAAALLPAGAGLLALAGPLGTTSAAAASPADSARPAVEARTDAGAVAAVSCYGGAVTVEWWNSYILYYPSSGGVRTTSRCRDINMRMTRGTTGRACVVFVDHTNECNRWTVIGRSWRTIATDVRDGTRFQVEAVGTDVTNVPDAYQAQIAY